MADERLRELERRWKGGLVADDADAWDRAHQRVGSVSPLRQAARSRLYGALLHRLTACHNVIFWKDKPSPISTRKLFVTLNGQRIWATHTARDLERIRDSIMDILDRSKPRALAGLGSRLPELIENHGATFPFIDSDTDGEGYILENVGGGLLFAPWGWEPSAGDHVVVQGIQADKGNNTPEDIAAARVNAKLLWWGCTYGMIEIEFTLTPTGAEA